MSDQGKWFKLWESSLDDFDLENLTIHEWYCWARLGVYIKKHGKAGRMTIRKPATAFINLFRVTSFEDVVSMIKRFPNYTFEEGQNVTANVTVESVTYILTCRNWSKYQGDFSGDRVKKHRHRVTANVTAQEEKRRDVEETRGEEKRILTHTEKLYRFIPPTASQVNTYAKEIGFELDGQSFCDSYAAKGWVVGRSPMKDWKAAVRTWRKNNFGGFGNANSTHTSRGYIGAETTPGKYASLGQNHEDADEDREPV